MATNKIKREFEFTWEQLNDFMWAINDIMRQGALTQGRACQLLAIEYKSGKPIENQNEN